jgi:hypothetical protein
MLQCYVILRLRDVSVIKDVAEYCPRPCFIAVLFMVAVNESWVTYIELVWL